jgi:hypothetical protein
MRELKTHVVEQEEQQRYLNQLDRAMGALSDGLTKDRDAQHLARLTTFAQEKQWDWKRLPKEQATYATLSKLVERVRQEYQWFSWKDAEKNPEENIGYFERLNISAETGLPWFADLMELHRLRRESGKLLSQMPEYKDLVSRLHSSLTTDKLTPEQVQQLTQDLHKGAMKRNFIDMIRNASLLGWESKEFSMPAQTTLLLPLGAESLWNVTFIRYAMESGMYHLYTIDTWQDTQGEQHITQKGISKELHTNLQYGQNVSAWYILKEIDDSFSALHPVHVSRGLMGPFENKYRTLPGDISPLPITQSLLQADSNASLLRFSRQYSYAPSHKEEGEQLRQVLYREDWRDELIVCNPSHSARVSESLEGADIRIIEM